MVPQSCISWFHSHLFPNSLTWFPDIYCMVPQSFITQFPSHLSHGFSVTSHRWFPSHLSHDSPVSHSSQSSHMVPKSQSYVTWFPSHLSHGSQVISHMVPKSQSSVTWFPVISHMVSCHLHGYPVMYHLVSKLPLTWFPVMYHMATSHLSCGSQASLSWFSSHVSHGSPFSSHMVLHFQSPLTWFPWRSLLDLYRSYCIWIDMYLWANTFFYLVACPYIFFLI